MIDQLAMNEVAGLPRRMTPGVRWHVITCEYPPQVGGVSDYTRLVAEQLAGSGDEVHVWRPRAGASPTSPGVTVHDTLGRASITDLWRVGKQLNTFAGPSRRLLVQWVPHGYGFRSMNLAFCLWLWTRAAWHGDQVEIMLHEPYLSFGEGSRRQEVVALVHRVMTVILLRAAAKVWMSIPAWEARWRPYTMGRKRQFQWLPIPSSIPVCAETSAVARVRQRYLRKGRFLLGHFGIHGSMTTQALEEILPLLLDRSPEAVILLIGKGSKEFRDKLLARTPQLTERIQAAGILAATDLSQCLAGCDLMLQPYPDGISARRTTAMAALAHGVPMVTTTGHLTEDFWLESDAVVTVPARNHAAFVEAANRLLADDSERNRMSLRAQRLYDEKFDVRHVIASLRRKSVAD
jgi:Glycosyl transferases group 1